MAFLWLNQVDGSGNPVLSNQVEGVETAAGGTQIGGDSGLQIVGVQGTNVSSLVYGRSGLQIAGTITSYGETGIDGDSGLTIFGSVDGAQSGETYIEGDSELEIETAQELFGGTEVGGDDAGLEVQGFNIGISSPALAEIIAGVTAALAPSFEAVPAETTAALREYEIRPGMTVDQKEYFESAALLGKHVGGKLLPGQTLPVPAGTLMRYMDPLDDTKVVVEYTIDADGNRSGLTYYDQQGNPYTPQ